MLCHSRKALPPLTLMLVILLYTSRITCQGPSWPHIANSVSLSDAFFPISHNGAQSKAYGWWYAQQLGTIAQQHQAGSCGDKLNLHWICPQTYTFTNACTQIAQHYTSSSFIQYTCYALSAINKCIDAITSLIKAYWRATTGTDIDPLNTNQQQQASNSYIALCHESNGYTNGALSYLQLAGKRPMHLTNYCKAWANILYNNPQKIIILFFESHLDKRSVANNAVAIDASATRKKLEASLQDSGLAPFCKKLAPAHYAGAKLPTAGQLRAENRRALIFIDAADSEILSSQYLNPEQIYRTHWQFSNGSFYADMQLNTCRLRERHAWDKPRVDLYRVDHGPENTAALDLYQCLEAIWSNLETLRTTWLPGNYWKINAYETLLQRYQHAKKEKQQAFADTKTHPPTIMMLDFIEIGAIQELTHTIHNSSSQHLIDDI